MKYEEIIKKMTLEEKAKLCVGDDYWHSVELEKYGIPRITMSDGPHGLRVQKGKGDNLGINKSEISICFPSLAAIGNSWNKKIAFELGECLGKEARSEEINIVLGPAINIKRSPLCGRNFEYISEDPYLTGVLGSEYVKGLQSQNIGACVKHFAVNNQENRRRTINVVVDERALREIYLKAFEMITEEAKPWTIMSAYNRLNGTYCTENKHLLYDILREEWGFNGIVISDWGAENDRVSGIKVEQELEMPGGRGNGVQEIIQAVKSGEIEEDLLNNIVDRIIDIAKRGEANYRDENNQIVNTMSESKESNKKQYDKQEHHNLALKIAEDTIVLLKNDEEILPLKEKRVALIGDLASIPRYQGAGSSTINPFKIENALDCLKNSYINTGEETDFEEQRNNEKNKLEIEFAKGYERIEAYESEMLRQEAVEIAKRNDVVIIFAGLTEGFESEGVDRTFLELPENQNKLIEEVYNVNPNIIVVLSHGAPIIMPWKNKVKAILTGYIGGEAGAKAMVNCILGKVNPSGKLAESYPERLEDTPCFKNFPGTELSVEYQESIYVGYRYYDKAQIDLAFPFGYGLSYTQFEYFDLKVENEGEFLRVHFKIKNTGKVKGKEIAQIYIRQENSVIFKPEKELKAFEKVELNPNEEKEIEVILDRKSFEYYNVETKKWAVESGKYQILIGKSSKQIELIKNIEIKSEDSNIIKRYSEKYYNGDIHNITDEEFEDLLGRKIPQRHITLDEITDENTLEQIKDTKIGRFIYDKQIEKMDKLLVEQSINKATKVMMNLQKPLKKFYEKKSSNFTKEMVDELLRIAKNDEDFEDNDFVKEYLEE